MQQCGILQLSLDSNQKVCLGGYVIEDKMAFYQFKGHWKGERTYMTRGEGNGGLWWCFVNAQNATTLKVHILH